MGSVILLLILQPFSSFSADFNQIRVFTTPVLNELISKEFRIDKSANPELSVHTGNEYQAIGALMFNTSDVVLLNREFTSLELAPYIHQYAGDMMKSPFSLLIGYLNGEPIYVYANKRPDVAFPPNITYFINKLISKKGQSIISNMAGFKPLNSIQQTEQLNKINFSIPPVEKDISQYIKTNHISGPISSVGSDGMKSLVDNWFNDFSKIYPRVKKGGHWEHLGTLNGFHALLVSQTDIAPMGRELWPEEKSAIDQTCLDCSFFEIRVAHGGFNTQQRTTVQSIFVSSENPLQTITLDQLKKIWGFDPSITRWGELGLTGNWTDRKINLFAPPLSSPNAKSLQFKVLNWGRWAENIQVGTVPWVSQNVALDTESIGFGGFEDMGKNVKSIDVSISDDKNSIKASAESVANRSYPLTRYMYIRMLLKKGEPLKPQVIEFLKYVVSRSAQNLVPYSGYFPLTKSESDEELKKLNQMLIIK